MTTGEEPFVTRKQLALAVLLALLSSLPGLALLYRNATTRTRPPAVAPVDRSGAEEGTRETALQGPQLRAPQAGRPLGYVPYRGPTPASLPASERAGPARERLASLNLTPPAAPTPTRASPLTTLPVPPSSLYPRGSPSGGGRPAPAPQPSAPASTPPRPPPMGLPQAWQGSSQSIVFLQTLSGEPATGIIVDPEGTLLARASVLGNPPSLTGVLAGGGTQAPTLKGIDPETDLAVFALSGSFQPLPVAPEPPAPGDILAFSPGLGSSASYQEARVVEVLEAEKLFLFRAPLLPASAGGPLVNERGEVAGIILGKPWSFPGSGFCLALGPGGIERVLARAREDRLSSQPGGEDPVAKRVVSLLRQSLPEPAAWPAPTRAVARVLPGQSLGPYRLGMTSAELGAHLGQGEAQALGGGLERWIYDGYKLDFWLVEGRVVAISTRDPFYATESGLGVASRLDQARLGPLEGLGLEGVGSGSRRLVAFPGLDLWADGQGVVTRLAVALSREVRP